MDERLTPNGEDLLELVPPFLREDPQILGTFGALGKENERIEAALRGIQDGSLPTLAEDPYLAIWELLLGIPVQPAEKTYEQRRSVVLAFLRRIDVSQEARVWVERLRELVGPFEYAVHHQDAIKSLYRDRFNGDELSSEWTWGIGSPSNIDVKEGAIRSKSTVGVNLFYFPAIKIADEFGILHFKRGAAGGNISVVLKYIDANNYLVAQVEASTLRIQECKAGTFTSLVSSSIATTERDYWLKTKIIGNAVSVGLYEQDPARMGAAVKTLSVALSGEGITKFGASVKAPMGVRLSVLSNDWLIKDILLGHSNSVIPAYTVEIAVTPTNLKQTELLARDITPAKLELDVTAGLGFILGDEAHGILGTSTL